MYVIVQISRKFPAQTNSGVSRRNKSDIGHAAGMKRRSVPFVWRAKKETEPQGPIHRAARDPPATNPRKCARGRRRQSLGRASRETKYAPDAHRAVQLSRAAKA